MYSVVIPSNFGMLSETISPIVMFDILNNEKGWDVNLLMSFDEEAQDGEDILDQMENIGYETNNCILNLSTMYFLLLVYLIDVAFTLCLAIFYRKTGKGKQLLIRKVESLFFAEILIISIESYIELYISEYLQVTKPFDTTPGEIQGEYMGWFLLFLGFVLVPFGLVWTYIQDKETLEDESFRKMWGPCYEGISLRDKWTKAYYIIYILRRAVFITVGLFVKEPVY